MTDLQSTLHTVHCECGAVYKVDEQPYRQTKPPKKKEWVGLTPEDKRIAGIPLYTDQISMSDAFDVIERILKEKNT